LQKFSCKHYEIVSEKIADGRQSKVGGYLWVYKCSNTKNSN
jgi:hypothetical protein